MAGTRLGPEVGAIYMVDFPLTSGTVSKLRPAICIASLDWADPDAIVIVCGVSSSERRREDSESVLISGWRDAGLDRESVAQVDRLFSTQSRYFQRQIGILPDGDQAVILLRLLENLKRGLPSNKLGK